MPGKNTGRKSRTFGTQTSGRQERAWSAGQEKGVQVGTYPDIAEKASAAMQKGAKECFPKTRKSEGEVYLFMRGRKEYFQRLKNAFIKDKRVVENYGGRYLGISDDLKRCEGDLYRGMADQCVIVIEFRDMAHAERWTHSSNIFKQKDFPSPADEIEMFATPISYIPDKELKAFQLIEMYGMQVPSKDFDDKYVKHVPTMLNKKHIYHGVVATQRVQRLRSCMIRPDTYILLFCADDESKLIDFYDSEEYRAFKAYRQHAVAETNTCIFTLKSVSN